MPNARQLSATVAVRYPPPAEAADGEEPPPPQTVGEQMEELAREQAMRAAARPPKTADELACLRAMGKAYKHVATQREVDVRRNLPPDVLASYVEP